LAFEESVAYRRSALLSNSGSGSRQSFYSGFLQDGYLLIETGGAGEGVYMLTGMGQEEKVSGDHCTLAQKKPWAFRIPVMLRSETGEQCVVAG